MAGIVASPNLTPFGSVFNANPFATLLESASFPPGTPRHIVEAFRSSDKDGNGFIDYQELKAVLSTRNHGFSLRTIHLLMYFFTASNTRLMGPKEFTQMFTSLQQWRDVFEKNDRDRNGKIEFHELQQTFQTLGFNVPKAVLKLLLLKFDRTGKTPALDYDKFIECCISVKGLTNKFKENESAATGLATFSYESFLFSVMPFVLA